MLPHPDLHHPHRSRGGVRGALEDVLRGHEAPGPSDHPRANPPPNWGPRPSVHVGDLRQTEKADQEGDGPVSAEDKQLPRGQTLGRTWYMQILYCYQTIKLII